MTNISDIEGIGDVYAGKLRAAGVSTVEALLEQGRTPKGRDTISSNTGVSEHHILKWVNHADLFRIKGVAGQFAELLEASGVDTVVELSKRNPEHLAEKMKEINDAKKLTHRVPPHSEVAEWVEQAKGLPRGVEY